jgi:hypothetical protein
MRHHDTSQIRKGMPALSIEGAKLGRISSWDGQRLRIEKGVLLRSEFEVELSQVSEVRDNVVWLFSSRQEVMAHPSQVECRCQPLEGCEIRTDAVDPPRAEVTMAEEQRIPVYEDQMTEHVVIVHTTVSSTEEALDDEPIPG